MKFLKQVCAALLLASGVFVAPAQAVTVTTVVTGLNNPFGLAADPSGNLFIADAGSGLILESFAPNYGTPVTVSSAISVPVGIAIDSHLNLFVADDNDETVKEILAPGYTVVVPLASGFSLLRGVAVDAQDNVFAADLFSNTVYKLPVANYAAKVAIGSGFNSPFGVAVDPSGNVFVTNQIGGPGRISEILAASGYTTVDNLSVSGSNSRGIAIDRARNLFYGTLSPSAVFEAFAPGYSTSTQLTGGINNANAVALDSIGNAFVTNGTTISELVGAVPANVVPANVVPALGPGGLGLLSLLLAGMGWWMLRRRGTA